MNDPVAELRSRVRGRVIPDEPLSRHTTYRIGGPALALVRPVCTDDVVNTIRYCNESGTRWLALGLGSNVLAPDEGLDAVVVKLGKGMDEVVEGAGGTERWRVGAGLPTPRLAKLSAAAGLRGAHRLIGVPGTVGGGVATNAGAHGQQYSDIVRSIEFVDRAGCVRSAPGDQIPWSYRDSGLEDVVVTAAVVELQPDDPADLEHEVRHYLRWRRGGTPFDEPCCGSVFRNPAPLRGGKAQAESRTAGQLIDAAGLKGFRVGAAQVSKLHANYIVNLGGATAADVRAVIDAVRSRVLAESGTELELEVKVIGS